MNRRKLVDHLRAHGCRPDHQGAKHEVWVHDTTGGFATVGRHTSVPKGTRRAICKQLGIPKAPGL